ncbi:hypothetical protein C9374_007439 [Naegleria lovaniensis]|uniref:Ras family small GTPase n=1 Tax=Naegleria lovaniensis TaxID=51637 RepID=A0AA88KH82_NAELO|nr:uncharacterized protein C9374_007439 [Naegleria lovaniensis]KAG2379300.1 hypothetical protein C9374_007439 [Naegleria lovaniensis]
MTEKHKSPSPSKDKAVDKKKKLKHEQHKNKKKQTTSSKEKAHRHRHKHSNSNNSLQTHHEDESTVTINEQQKNYKIGMLGDSGVGKASLCVEFTKSRKVRASRPSAYDPTDERRFYQILQIEDESVSVQIINNSGQEMMSAVEDIYYSKCLGFLLIFAVDDRESFHNATTRHFEKILRVKDAEDNEDIPHNIPIILVGNKADVDPTQRKVSKEEAIQFCNRKFLKYIETSTFEQVNIYEAFEMIVREIIESNFIEGMKSKLKDQDKYISSRSSRNKHTCNIL